MHARGGKGRREPGRGGAEPRAIKSVWLWQNTTKAQPRSRIRTDGSSLLYLYHHHLPVPFLPMIARSQTPAINLCARYTESDSCICCAHWSPDVPRNSTLTLTALTLALSLVGVARLPYP